ncbi:MAG TPA: hypothetical protein VEY30_08515, partial [Myxococcaceae bacterium]|nr:hypothetical protein [Myxococcaceae bacterium]
MVQLLLGRVLDEWLLIPALCSAARTLPSWGGSSRSDGVGSRWTIIDGRNGMTAPHPLAYGEPPSP